MQYSALVLFVIILKVHSNEIPHRFCTQCIAGQWLDKKWLMQDNRAGQSILWMDDWERTDCGVADKTRILKCYSSCLKVTLERLTAGGPKFEALVKDCSDDMIFDSPDLPKEINFRNYNGDEKFVNNRSNFRITYEFSTKGVVNRTQVMGELALLKLPRRETEISFVSFIIYIVCLVLLISVISAACFLIFCPDCRCRNPQYKSVNLDQLRRIEEVQPSAQDSSNRCSTSTEL